MCLPPAAIMPACISSAYPESIAALRCDSGRISDFLVCFTPCHLGNAAKLTFRIHNGRKWINLQKHWLEPEMINAAEVVPSINAILDLQFEQKVRKIGYPRVSVSHISDIPDSTGLVRMPQQRTNFQACLKNGQFTVF